MEYSITVNNYKICAENNKKYGKKDNNSFF
jgi:hypothetical protein